MELKALDHVALAVADVERSVAWYMETLGFRNLHPGQWDGVPVFVGNDAAAIALFPRRTATAAQASERGRKILHFAFRTTRDGFVSAQKELTRRGVPFEFQDHEISQSIYFHDPDNHEIEITTYELKG